MIEKFVSLFQTEFYMKVWRTAAETWPIWLPLILINLLFHTWFAYKRRVWMREQGSVLLEIKIPKDVLKSPAAMEMVIEGIWEDVVGTLTDVYLEGRVRDWFSLEIVSICGEVKFFILGLKKWKNIIETRVYTHYPGAEVFEAEDYALNIVYDPTKMSVWGITTKLNKPDAYPIKTYIDYELDKVHIKDQGESVDPITPLLEYLGSLNPGEQAWVQIMIQAHRKEGLLDARFLVKPDWKDGIKKSIKDIIEKEAPIKAEKDKPASILGLTEDQRNTIKSIERNAGKLAFDA